MVRNRIRVKVRVRGKKMKKHLVVFFLFVHGLNFGVTVLVGGTGIS